MSSKEEQEHSQADSRGSATRLTGSTRSVYQLLHTLSYGDAISSEALTLKRVLRAAGLDSQIYALNVHPRLKGEATAIDRFSAEHVDEVVLHYSLGSPLNDLYRSLADGNRVDGGRETSAGKTPRLTMVYHNITPAHWFSRVNPRITRDVTTGIEELPSICACSDRVIADSAFNAAELTPYGVKASVLHLPFDPERWRDPANPGIRSALQSEGGIHVLHVGRLAPNKCIEDIIKSFCFLHHHIERRSTLWLPGIDIDTELYSFSLKRLVRELALEDAVRFPGCMDDTELRALYEEATVYTVMSEHEGFCLPILEAMHFGCPVIAFSSSAVPETLGEGGILVTEKRHPELAELMHLVATDKELRGRLVTAGRKNVEKFSESRFASAVRALFAGGE